MISFMSLGGGFTGTLGRLPCVVEPFSKLYEYQKEYDMSKVEQVIIEDEIFLIQIRRDKTVEESLAVAATDPKFADELGLKAMQDHLEICKLEKQLQELKKAS